MLTASGRFDGPVFHNYKLRDVVKEDGGTSKNEINQALGTSRAYGELIYGLRSCKPLGSWWKTETRVPCPGREERCGRR